MSKTFLKVLFLLFSSFMIMFYTKIYQVGIIFVILSGLISFLKIQLPYKYIFLIILPVYLLFGLTYMVEYGFSVDILIKSVLNSSVTILKLLNLIFLNIIFIKSTSFIELTDSFNRLKLSKKFLFSIMILTSILPLIFKTASQIYDAQRLRGLKKRDFLTTDGWILFLSPLFIHVFSYSQQISLQLELKNYSEIVKLEENTAEIKDYFVFIMAVLFMVVVYCAESAIA